MKKTYSGLSINSLDSNQNNGVNYTSEINVTGNFSSNLQRSYSGHNNNSNEMNQINNNQNNIVNNNSNNNNISEYNNSNQLLINDFTNINYDLLELDEENEVKREISEYISRYEKPINECFFYCGRGFQEELMNFDNNKNIRNVGADNNLNINKNQSYLIIHTGAGINKDILQKMYICLRKVAFIKIKRLIFNHND